jgi:hypothetical protein
MTLFRKNVILRGHDIHSIPLSEGLEKKNRLVDNNENFVSLMGTKQQINRYLQDAHIVSERLRTLNDLPKMRVINSVKVNIQ